MCCWKWGMTVVFLGGNFFDWGPSPEADSVLELKDMEAAQNPFYLRVITNIYNPETLFILAEFLENGNVVAKRTASHFTVTP